MYLSGAADNGESEQLERHCFEPDRQLPQWLGLHPSHRRTVDPLKVAFMEGGFYGLDRFWHCYPVVNPGLLV